MGPARHRGALRDILWGTCVNLLRRAMLGNAMYVLSRGTPFQRSGVDSWCPLNPIALITATMEHSAGELL
eukprot:8626535-Pyramimonas_sp.AAC.1